LAGWPPASPTKTNDQLQREGQETQRQEHRNSQEAQKEQRQFDKSSPDKK